MAVIVERMIIDDHIPIPKKFLEQNGACIETDTDMCKK